MGTPAEEGGGGKIQLIAAGAFADVDFAMMVHPWAFNDLEPVLLCAQGVSSFFVLRSASSKFDSVGDRSSTVSG